MSDATVAKNEGRANERRRLSMELTKEILNSEDSAEVKVMRLHTECGFGMMRAEELVYGAARPKQPYKNVELNKNIGRFYKHDS